MGSKPNYRNIPQRSMVSFQGLAHGGGGARLSYPLIAFFCHLQYMIMQRKYIYLYITWSVNSRRRIRHVSKKFNTPLISVLVLKKWCIKHSTLVHIYRNYTNI